MRIAVVDQDRCQPRKCNYECVRFCPVVRQGQGDCIQPRPGDGKARISEELCIGCGICVNKCPFDAIKIINLPEALDTDLVHRFGENAFSLFRLPIPKAGQVVGLLGPNGIGKTTAIHILAGEMAPNLGQWEPDADDDGTRSPAEIQRIHWERAAEANRGTELGDYLRKVASGEVRTALKPQYVDRLPRVVQGRVGELLERVDERGLAERYIEELDLGHVVDQDLASLSGGELQRTAIAATLVRDADVYFIDEPSSYLDIHQRLNAARLIREVGEEHGRAVLVIEHDLAILDYIADEVHLLYGNEGAYGVVALPRPVRTAINVYLDGYMREENVRFRDYGIEFTVHPPRKAWQSQTLLDFPALAKRYDEGFELEVGGGTIHEGEVVGVVGPNATGKTTFVKLLAGVDEPTEGQVDVDIRVAYKPQYIKTEDTGTVQSLFYRELGAEYTGSFFQAEVARPMNLKALEGKRLDELSGGELQRVATSLCLGKEADLYLLDEPSAYLDADQRMVAARMVRRVMEKRGKSALIVDHDVYFIDLVSDSLMVFGGEPSLRGTAAGPLELREGMNRFLSDVGVTFRRDKETNRPRVNKPGSRLDREQRNAGEYYYEPRA